MAGAPRDGRVGPRSIEVDASATSTFSSGMIPCSIRLVAARVALASVASTALTFLACSSDRPARPAQATAQHTAGATTNAKPATTTTAVPTPATDTSRAASTGDTLRASVAGVGPVRFGATLDVAARAAGGTVARPPGGSCGFVSFRALPHGVRFMVSYDTVVRADVDSATIATDAGARVGMSEDSVQHLYGRRLRVTPHKYVSGAHYLTSIPGAPADTVHRIVFETDGVRVTRYRAGLVPFVENVEGCG